MKISVKTILALVFYCSLAGIVLLAIAYLYERFLLQKSVAHLDVILSSFLGAFFAFFFVMIEKLVERIWTRSKEHYNGLVSLQHKLSYDLHILQTDIVALESLIKTCRKEALSQHYLNFNEVEDFEIDKTIGLRINDIDLINKFSIYQDYLASLNSDFGMIRRAYSEIKGLLGKDESSYLTNIKLLEKLAIQIRVFLEDQMEEIVELSAAVNILLRTDQTSLIKGVRFVTSKNSLAKISQEELEEEKKVVVAGFEETKAKNKEKIEQLEQKINAQ